MKRSLSEPNLVNIPHNRTIAQQESLKNVTQLNPQCTICHDVLLFPCTLGCGHSFCYRCLKNLHKHVHRNYDNNSESDEEPENGNVTQPLDLTQTYRNSFFDEQCFKTIVGGKLKQNFSSKLFLDKERLLTHILQDSIFCRECPGLKCPTCRLNVKVMPKPNILLHESLKQLLGQYYEDRVEEYLETYSQDFIIERYEQSDRFKTIKMLVSESIGAIEQAVSFSILMDSFNSYADIEIVWCLSKLLKDNMFVIVRDFIISNSHYSSDVSKLLNTGNLTNEDIMYLIVYHPNFSLGNGTTSAVNLTNNIKNKFKNVKKSGILDLIDNEEKMDEALRECIITNNLLNW